MIWVYITMFTNVRIYVIIFVNQMQVRISVYATLTIIDWQNELNTRDNLGTYTIHRHRRMKVPKPLVRSTRRSIVHLRKGIKRQGEE